MTFVKDIGNLDKTLALLSTLAIFERDVHTYIPINGVDLAPKKACLRGARPHIT